jgi:protein-disulfide isomerase
MLLLAFAALGLGASAWSSYVHYSLLTQPGYTSICDVNATVSCTQAYLSEYGSLWGVPVALLGVVFFTLVLLMTAFAGRPAPPPVRGKAPQPSTAENVPGYIFALSTLGLAVVLYLAWASIFRLQSICLLCAATYVAVIGLFVVSGGSTSFSMTALPRRASRDLSSLVRSPLALAIAVVFSIGAVSLIAAFPREASVQGAAAAGGPQSPPLTDQQRFELIKWYEVQPRLDVPVDAGGAKVVILKFNDYQCPPCRQTHYDYKSLIAKYEGTGQVKYELKHFPLEGECNPPMAGGSHTAACEAAAAVVMARGKGTADRMEEWLFSNQSSLTAASIKEAAKDVAGIPDFDAQYPKVLEQVRNDAALGVKLGAKSTPTFFINGRRIAGGLPPAAFALLIEEELKR